MLVIRYIAFTVGCLLITVYAAPHEVRRRKLVEKKLPAWIGGPYNEFGLLGPSKPKKAFSNTLMGISLLPRLPDIGKGNAGLYELVAESTYKSQTGKEYKGKDLFLKVMKKIDDFAYGEVKALMDVGEGNYVDSGMLALDPKKPESLVPVILMLKKPGEILTKSNEFVTAEPQQKLTMKTQTVRFTCAKFVDLVFNKHIVHGDNNGDNILVEFWPSKNVKSVELVDWGLPGARYVNVKKLGKVARSDVYQWCTENFVW